MKCDASVLLDCQAPQEYASIVNTLNRFGGASIAFAHRRRIKVAALHRGECFADRSAALRRLSVRVDNWPAPPAGLFVVEERTVYLRSYSPMTVAHEFGHALDCALGEGIYRSSSDPSLRRLFANAGSYVTPYAATGLDEYFAECVRAYVEINDVRSFWPRVSRKRLQRVDPEMFAYVDRLFTVEFVQGIADAGDACARSS